MDKRKITPEKTLRLMDQLAYTPQRRALTGHFVKADFKDLSLPHVFENSDFTAQAEDFDGEERVCVRKKFPDADGTLDDENSALCMLCDPKTGAHVVPFKMRDKMYIAECAFPGFPALEVSKEEYRMITGRSADDFDAEEIIAEYDGEDIHILDITSSTLFFAMDMGENNPEERGICIYEANTDRFLMECGSLFTRYGGETIRTLCPMMNTGLAKEMISESIGATGHFRKGDELWIDFYKFLGGRSERRFEMPMLLRKRDGILTISDTEGRGVSFTFPPNGITRIRVLGEADGFVKIALLDTRPVKGVMGLSMQEFSEGANMSYLQMSEFTLLQKETVLPNLASEPAEVTIVDCDGRSVTVMDETGHLHQLRWESFLQARVLAHMKERGKI